MNRKQLPTHPFTRQRALGFRKDGRPIWPIAGGAPTDDEHGDGGDGEGGTDDGGGTGSLLDGEAEHEDEGDGGESGSADTQTIVNEVVKALEGRFDSIADRRVNAILKEVRKQQGKAKEDDSDDGSSSGGRSAGVQAGDVREARLAYREYVGDEIKFLGGVEREHGMTLAQGLLASRLADGEDPETAGRETAREVAKQIKSLRKHYEGKTLAALRRSGQIPEDGRGPGQPSKGPAKPGDQSGWQAGAAKANQMFADRLPQTQQN